MKSFLASSLNAAATECTGCGQSAVRSAGQENQEPATPAEPAAQPEAAAAPAAPEKKPTAILPGPLGYTITKAIEQAFAKPQMSPATEGINANAQIQEGGSQTVDVHRVKRIVGVLPYHGEEPTPLNTFIDAAKQVDNIDFVFVRSMTGPITGDNSAQDGTALVINDGNLKTADSPSGMTTQVAVESIEVVIKYRNAV